MSNKYDNIYNENSGPLELSLVLLLNKTLLFWNKKIEIDDITLLQCSSGRTSIKHNQTSTNDSECSFF